MLKQSASGATLRITNLTRFDADVSIFAESSGQAKMSIGYTVFLKVPKINVPSGKLRTINISPNESTFVHYLESALITEIISYS